MRKIVSVFVVFLFISSNIFSAVINEKSGILLAGISRFSAVNENSGNEIQWKVNLILRDENSLAVQVTENVYTARGDSVEFLLIKYTNKFTYFDIIADDGIQADTIRVQIFDKNVSQKYYFENADIPSKPMIVYIVIPGTFSPKSKFIMIMHGTNRNADDYIIPWKNFAVDNDYIAAAPEFNKIQWAHSRSYNLGNMFTGSNGTGSLNPKFMWSFSVAQKIHLELKEKLGLQSSKYDIWGHSAGAQFVHRMMLFLPDSNVRYAIPANAGWYSAPDLNIQFPYGMKNIHLSYNADDLYLISQQKMIIMRGTADTLRDSNLNTSAGADAQGYNRFERAEYFYNKGFEISDSCKWQLIDVPSVGHDNKLMAPAAQQFLIDNVTSVPIFENRKIKSFSLFNNYPNPFNPTTIISFNISKNSFVTLRIFNVMGQEITVLYKGKINAGYHQFLFNASNNLPSGIYFYNVIVDNHSGTKKMVLLK